jgi:hypothetical protein
MTKRIHISWTIFALLIFGCVVMGQQTVQLSTGFDNALITQTVYPNPGSPSGQHDNYWINIATSPNAPAGPAWVLHYTQPGWVNPMANSTWISAWNRAASQPGVTPINRGYAVFKKCFCLLDGYKKLSLSFQVRADNNINAYVNSTLNQILTPAIGNWGSGSPLQSLPINQSWFHVGKNCLYVYVEDDGGLTGFDLSGTVSALGLLPTPAMGTNGTFAPCECQGRPTGREMDNDSQVVQEILKIVAARRGGAKQ